MTVAAWQVVDEFNRACQNLSRSIEPGNLPRDLDMPVSRLRYLDEAIEYVRKPLVGARSALRNRRGDDIEYTKYVLYELSERLDQVRADLEFREIAAGITFKQLSPTYHKYGEPILHEGLLAQRTNLLTAMELIEASVASLDIAKLIGSSREQDSGKIEITNLSRVLPREQALAPAHFAVSADRVVIVPQESRPDLVDVANVNSAKTDIQARGHQIIDALMKSNCDARLVEGYKELQEHIESGSDVIRSGLTNLACSHLHERFEDELPDSLYGLMQAQSAAISMYLGQFDDWRRFVHQAASANLERTQAPEVAAAAVKLAEGLEKHPEAADSAIPRLLRKLADLTKTQSGRKEVLLALFSTLTNLLQTISVRRLAT